MRSKVTIAVGILVLVGGVALPPAHAATPLCFGEQPTIVGTSGDDFIIGTSGYDVIYAGRGDDFMGTDYEWGDGTVGDLFCGGPGADIIDAGPGNDKVRGGTGDDEMRGHFGVDVLLGDAGNDAIMDSEGDHDFPDSEDPGTDIIRGGVGDDWLRTTSGSDKVFGGGGSDNIRDFSHVKSYLHGGAGDDVLDARDDNNGPNPVVGDLVSGGGGAADSAMVNRADTVTGSTEQVTWVD